MNRWFLPVVSSILSLFVFTIVFPNSIPGLSRADSSPLTPYGFNVRGMLEREILVSQELSQAAGMLGCIHYFSQNDNFSYSLTSTRIIDLFCKTMVVGQNIVY